MTALYIIIALAIIIAIWAIAVYNSLIRLRNKADEAEAGIDAHLKQRYDLVPNLVETVKGYAAHENSTLDAVIGREALVVTISRVICFCAISRIGVACGLSRTSLQYFRRKASASASKSSTKGMKGFLSFRMGDTPPIYLLRAEYDKSHS